MSVVIMANAEKLAREVHKGMIRGYNKQKPYWTHLHEVSELVRISGGSAHEIAAAWLHDSVEDTPTSLDDVQTACDKEVMIIVRGLTDLPEMENQPPAIHKRMQAERIKNESDSVKRVKLADQISNVRAAVDPDQGWSAQMCIDYIEGAKLVADECAGISEYLDREFISAYKIGIEVHS